MHSGDYPDGSRVRWERYDGQPRGGSLIAMAPWFDDGSVSAHISAKFYWKDAAAAHRKIEQGHTRGKIVLSWMTIWLAQLGCND